MHKGLMEIVSLFCFQNVHIHIVDMSSARQVWEFAQNFTQNNSVHVLVGGLTTSVSSSVTLTLFCVTLKSPVHQINNAGCMVNQRELTEEGVEKNFATNTLGKIFVRVE